MISKFVVILVLVIYAVLAYIPAEHEHLSEGYDLPSHTFASSHRPTEESDHGYKSAAASSSQYTAAAKTSNKQSSVYVARGHSTYFKPENTVSQSGYHSADLHYGNIPTQHTIANIPKFEHQYDHTPSIDYSSNKGNPIIKYQSPSSSIGSDNIPTDKHYLSQDYYVTPSVGHHHHHQPSYHNTDPSPSTYSKYADVTQSSNYKNVVSYSPASEVSRTSFHGTNYQYAY